MPNGKNTGKENQTFKAENNADKPKYYVLDMFHIHLERAYT
jgi:leucyl-tRNA synthetase